MNTYERYDQIRTKLGLTNADVSHGTGIDTRFHDLRHFSVSIAHALGVGDQYIMHRHGFATDSTMKRVYRNEIDTYEKQANDVINDFYEKNFK